MLQNGDAAITVVGDPTAGIIRISVANAKTAQLAAGVYFDALQVSFGDIVSPLWVGQILVAANPFGGLTEPWGRARVSEELHARPEPPPWRRGAVAAVI